jgi:hypothetical protein
MAATASAACAILAMMAASASATTVLCSKTRLASNPCASADVLPAGAAFGAAMSQLKLSEPDSGESGLFKCGDGMVGVASTQQSGEPLPARTENSIWSCKGFGGNKCSSVGLSDPNSSMQSTGVSTGRVTLGSASEPLTVSFTCQSVFGSLSCGYAAPGGVSLEINYATSEAIVKPVTMKLASGYPGLCPTEGQQLSVNAHLVSSTVNINVI